MGALDRIAARLGYVPKGVVRQAAGSARRSFAAAQISRLLADWGTTNTALDADLQRGLSAMRARSRTMGANNPYARRFFRLVQQNVVGSAGIKLQVKAKTRRGELDRRANERIEAAWQVAGRRGAFDVTGRLSRADGERLFAATCAEDGECLVRIVPGFGDAGFAVQFLDTDRLDIELNRERRGNRNRIRMGVELDEWDRPVAYHLKTGRHPNDTFGATRGERRERVPASQIIHGFIPIRSEQTRGVPWMHAALVELHNLGGYQEAAIVAARVGANKLGWFKGDDGEPISGDDEDADGNVIMDASPGEFGQLTGDAEVVKWDPNYPHEQFGEFVKANLRGVASGVNAAYNTYTNDLEGVTFGTQRSGMLDERDGWMVLQDWMVSAFNERLYAEWLRFQLTTKALPQFAGFNLTEFDKLNAATWQPRRWQWIDPQKDTQANVLAAKERLTSRSAIIRALGRDPDDVFDEIKAEQDRMSELGILPEQVDAATAAGAPDDDEDD